MVSREAVADRIQPIAAALANAHENAVAHRKAVASLPTSATLDPRLASSQDGTAEWVRFATDASPHVETIGTPDLNAHPLSRIWTIPTPEGSFRLQLKSDIDDVRAEQRQTELLPRSPAENRTSLVLLTWGAGTPRLVALERGVVLWSIDVVALATPTPVEAIRTTARRGVRSRAERQETGERRETS